MWQSKFTLFIGTQATNFGGSGVVNDNPPVQVSLTVDELSDLKDFIEDALKLNEEGAQPPA